MVQMHIMVPDELRDIAVRDAHKHEMNMSEYVRFLIELGHEIQTHKESQATAGK